MDALLLEWKNSRSLKPLLLRGARQVGKSWAVEHLGESFDYFIEINFEKRPVENPERTDPSSHCFTDP